jgi:hydrogenase expression/formation protein HypE
MTTFDFSCPTPALQNEVITMAHGGGGKLTHRLIKEIFIPIFSNEKLTLMHDGAFLPNMNAPLAFTTDSYVIKPLFFPGGDIGTLSITGTINDLAMCGAKPLYISCGFIIEEGFAIDDVKKIAQSMQDAAAKDGALIVTGDTKIIERSEGKNLFITTSGIGALMTSKPIGPAKIKQGDLIILSGDIGRHGVAIMAKREGLDLSTPLQSDCESLFPYVEALITNGVDIHCLRDLTRGGLATALVELAEGACCEMLLKEEAIAVGPQVEGVCEILGLDPLYVANEGRFIAILAEKDLDTALAILRNISPEQKPSVIGRVNTFSSRGSVIMENAFGTKRYLYRLLGEQLPRIC